MTQFLLAVLHIRLFTWFEHEVVCLLRKHKSEVLKSDQIPYCPEEMVTNCVIFMDDKHSCNLTYFPATQGCEHTLHTIVKLVSSTRNKAFKCL